MMTSETVKVTTALHNAALPKRLVKLCGKLVKTEFVKKDSIAVVEFFAGIQTIVEAGRGFGFPAVPCRT